MTVRVRWIGVALAVPVLLAGCSADCSCVAPEATIDQPADSYAPGTTVDVSLTNLYAECCDTGSVWPWGGGEPAMMKDVTLSLVAVNTAETTLGSETVPVADDGTATVTLTIPEDAKPGHANIVLDGLAEFTIQIAGSS